MSVIINGGGISGVILALILSRLTHGNLNIYLIDDIYTLDSSSVVRDSRYIALSYSAYYKLMSFLNVSSTLSFYSTAIKEIEVSNHHQENVVFSASEYCISAWGYVVELHYIRTKIFDLLRQFSSVKLFYPIKLKKVIQNKLNNIVMLEDGYKIFSQLLIAADGSYSLLATLCGMQWDFFDYKQVAVIANIVTEFPNKGRAYEIFMSYGSLALLPISDNKSTLIWCVPFSYKQEINSWNSLEFCNNLQKIIGWKLGDILDVDKRCFFSLFLRKAKCHISHRLALVANAAQTLHPIAGQGFNLGFRDIINISEIISWANIQNIDVGDQTILKLYQQSRELDQFKVISMIHSLMYLFGSSSCFLKFSRSYILSVIGYSSLLRNILMKMILQW